MFSRELRLLDKLQGLPRPVYKEFSQEHIIRMKKRLEQPHDELWRQRLYTPQEDREEPLFFTVYDMVWLENTYRKESTLDYNLSFVGPYRIKEV